MRTSHIIYKVKDLTEAVEIVKSHGFTIEYGRAKNPKNALIYFSEGPYIELLKTTGTPKMLKKIFSLTKRNHLMNQIHYWDNYDHGLCGLCLETDNNNLDTEVTMLSNQDIECLCLSPQRIDTYGRKLTYKVAFPEKIGLPFMMTYFNIDPKPKNYIHPNGCVRVNKIMMQTDKELVPIIHELCDDELLELKSGHLKFDFTLEYQDKTITAFPTLKDKQGNLV